MKIGADRLKRDPGQACATGALVLLARSDAPDSVAHLDTSCVAAIPAPAFDLALQALAGSG